MILLMFLLLATPIVMTNHIARMLRQNRVRIVDLGVAFIIAEDLAPFAEAAVAGQDQRSAFVAGVDQLEEQVGASGGDGQITDLIDLR
jgi:hypothetical protein